MDTYELSIDPGSEAFTIAWQEIVASTARALHIDYTEAEDGFSATIHVYNTIWGSEPPLPGPD